MGSAPGGEWGLALQEASPFLLNLRAPTLVAVLAHLLYFRALYDVGLQRRKDKIWYPRMTGTPEFERALRVQYNFLEQYLSFVVSMYLCAVFINGNLAGALGLVWVVLRYLYGERYKAAHFKYDMLKFTLPMYLLVGVMYMLPAGRILYWAVFSY